MQKKSYRIRYNSVLYRTLYPGIKNLKIVIRGRSYRRNIGKRYFRTRQDAIPLLLLECEDLNCLLGCNPARSLSLHQIKIGYLINKIEDMFEKYENIGSFDGLAVEYSANIVKFPEVEASSIEEVNNFLENEKIDTSGLVNSICEMFDEYGFFDHENSDVTPRKTKNSAAARCSDGLESYRRRSRSHKERKSKKNNSYFVSQKSG